MTEVYFAVGLAHNLISYGKLDAKGYVLGRRGTQRVLETRDGKCVILNVELSQRVLMVEATVIQTRQHPRNLISC